ncbi:hypothetical protein IFM89_026972 [Coptis chinensis]|uniref:Uncharacterized protein n=1 Tax=Coptis chinensis TaxID=261450 RepID=A0A835I6W0_9MAGN|nr:hypothetical protein IFM89_026972 [Coptis chinensis]
MGAIQNRSTILKKLWQAAIIGGMVSLWLHRNKVHFEDCNNILNFCQSYVRRQLICAGHLSKDYMRIQDIEALGGYSGPVGMIKPRSNWRCDPHNTFDSNATIDYIVVSFDSDEFWDLYRSHFHHLMVQGDLRICLYSPTSCASDKMGAVTHDE